MNAQARTPEVLIRLVLAAPGLNADHNPLDPRYNGKGDRQELKVRVLERVEFALSCAFATRPRS